MEVHETAERLREQGLTYKEISSTLNGAVSVDWCKRNLKDVTKGNTARKSAQTLPEALSAITKLATRDWGCTNYEMKGVLFQYHEEEQVNKGDLMRNYKRRATYNNKDCLFRPAWISTSDVKASQMKMYMLANEMYERLEEAVSEYLQEFPDTHRGVVLHELVLLSYGNASPEGLENRLTRNNKAVDTMIERMHSTALSSL